MASDILTEVKGLDLTAAGPVVWGPVVWGPVVVSWGPVGVLSNVVSVSAVPKVSVSFSH